MIFVLFVNQQIMKNKVRQIMYGAIIAMLGLMSLKKLDIGKFNLGTKGKEFEEVHTTLV